MKKYKVIKVEPQGYCGGVLKAIAIAKKTRQDHPDTKITILGNLVHNQYVKQALAYEHIDTIEDTAKTRMELLDDIHTGIVIFTAHGIAPDVKAKAIQKGLKVVDASCPFVLQTQRAVIDKLNEGFDIFYIGKYRHPEAESIYTLSDRVHLIQDNEIPDVDTRKIFVTNQTTMSIIDIDTIFTNIKKKYPFALFHDEICNATRVRQQAVMDLREVDALIIVGDPTSNNTQKLFEIASHIPIRLKVETLNDLQLSDLQDAQTVAVTSGASTPTYLTNQIIAFLEGRDNKKAKIRIDQIL